MNMIFEMIIEDIFHFFDGRTVFASEIVHGPAYINKGVYIILIGAVDRGA